jgi:hypothetical protein
MTGIKRDRETRGSSRLDNRTAASPPRFSLRLQLLAAVAALGIVAAACGSSGGAAAPSPSASVEAALLAFSQCIRDQGITDMPDPTVDSEGNVQIGRPPGGDDSAEHDAFAAVREKCDRFLQGVTQGFSHGDTAQTQDQFLRLARCMRDRGVNVPDPDFSGGGHDPGAQFLDAINQSDPTVQEALRVCGQQVFGSGSVGLGHGAGH